MSTLVCVTASNEGYAVLTAEDFKFKIYGLQILGLRTLGLTSGWSVSGSFSSFNALSKAVAAGSELLSSPSITETGSAVAAGDAALAGSCSAAAGDLCRSTAPLFRDGLAGEGLDAASADAGTPGAASAVGSGAGIDGCSADGGTRARTSFRGAGACATHCISYNKY